MSIAEAAFKSTTAKPTAPAPAATRAALPRAKELVSIRLDSDVLAHFQGTADATANLVEIPLKLFHWISPECN